MSYSFSRKKSEFRTIRTVSAAPGIAKSEVDRLFGNRHTSDLIPQQRPQLIWYGNPNGAISRPKVHVDQLAGVQGSSS